MRGVDLHCRARKPLVRAAMPQIEEGRVCKIEEVEEVCAVGCECELVGV